VAATEQRKVHTAGFDDQRVVVAAAEGAAVVPIKVQAARLDLSG